MVMSVKDDENEINKHQYERSVELESINEKENTSDVILKKPYLICVPLICGLVLGITILVHFVHSFQSDDPNVMLISLGFIRFHTEMEYRAAENLASDWYYFSKESETLRNASRRCQSLINGIFYLINSVNRDSIIGFRQLMPSLELQNIFFYYLFYFVKIGSHLVEVRLLKQHLEITKYLSTLRPHNLWWIGATDASPIASKEGEFVWLTDNAYVDHIGNHLVVKPPFDYSNESHDRLVTFWGPGQPDNWPNQVNRRTFITNI